VLASFSFLFTRELLQRNYTYALFEYSLVVRQNRYLFSHFEVLLGKGVLLYVAIICNS